MLFLNIRKTRCHFGPRLLYFGHSLYHLALDLSLAIQFQNHTRFSLQILTDSIHPVLPVLMLEYQCHQNRLFLNHYGLFWIRYSTLLKRLYLADTSPSHWIWKYKFLSKPCCYFLLIIFDQRAISHPCGSFWREIILLNSKITTEKYLVQILNELSPWHLFNLS